MRLKQEEIILETLTEWEQTGDRHVDEQAFHALLDDLMFAIEDEVDTLDDDFDFDRTSGQLVITFPNTSQVIVSRQVVQQQLWVAAKSGGSI